MQANEEKMGMPQMELQIGDYVEHRVFGRGKIMDIKKESASFVIKFEKSETERNLSFRAPIKKISYE